MWSCSPSPADWRLLLRSFPGLCTLSCTDGQVFVAKWRHTCLSYTVCICISYHSCCNPRRDRRIFCCLTGRSRRRYLLCKCNSCNNPHQYWTNNFLNRLKYRYCTYTRYTMCRHRGSLRDLPALVHHCTCDKCQSHARCLRRQNRSNHSVLSSHRNKRCL